MGHANWASQFKDAISVSGGDDEDEDEGSSGPGYMDPCSLLARLLCAGSARVSCTSLFNRMHASFL